MSFFRKSICLVMAMIILTMSISQPTSARTPDNFIYNAEEMVEPEITPQSVSIGVAIFVAGVLVGYIVDGVIIYETGQSAGEWVAEALRRWRQGSYTNNQIHIKRGCGYAPGQPCN